MKTPTKTIQPSQESKIKLKSITNIAEVIDNNRKETYIQFKKFEKLMKVKKKKEKNQKRSESPHKKNQKKSKIKVKAKSRKKEAKSERRKYSESIEKQVKEKASTTKELKLPLLKNINIIKEEESNRKKSIRENDKAGNEKKKLMKQSLKENDKEKEKTKDINNFNKEVDKEKKNNLNRVDEKVPQILNILKKNKIRESNTYINTFSNTINININKDNKINSTTSTPIQIHMTSILPITKLNIKTMKSTSLKKTSLTLNQRTDLYYLYWIGNENNGSLIRRCFEFRTKWRSCMMTPTTIFNLRWKDTSSGLDFNICSNTCSEMKRMYNHYDNHEVLSNKMNLFLNMLKYSEKKGMDIFKYLPFTVLLDYNSSNFSTLIENFKEVFNNIENYMIEYNKILIPQGNSLIQSNSNSNFSQNNNQFRYSQVNEIRLGVKQILKRYGNKFLSSYSYSSSNGDKLGNRTFISICNSHYFNKNLWIIKAVNLNRGRGIRILNEVNEIVSFCKLMHIGIDKKVNINQYHIEDILEEKEDEKNEMKENLIEMRKIKGNVYNSSEFKGKLIEISNGYENKQSNNEFKSPSIKRINRLDSLNISYTTKEKRKKEKSEEKGKTFFGSVRLEKINKLNSDLKNEENNSQSDTNNIRNSFNNLKILSESQSPQDKNHSERNNSVQSNNSNRRLSKINHSKVYRSSQVVLQKYIEKPFLYNNRKCDLRIWVLISHKQDIFVCKEGHFKVCSEEYDLNKKDTFAHITNYSVQKYSKSFSLYEIGNEISYDQFQASIKKSHSNKKSFREDILPLIYNIIKISFFSVYKKLKVEENMNTFEIFGYDFLLDENLNPFLIEINTNPGYELSSPLISIILPRMIEDALRLTVDDVFPTQYLINNQVVDKENYKSPFLVEGYSEKESIWELIGNLRDGR